MLEKSISVHAKSFLMLTFLPEAAARRCSVKKVFLRRAYTMNFFFRDHEIFILKEKCRNISESEMCVMKYYSVCSRNQVSFIRA